MKISDLLYSGPGQMGENNSRLGEIEVLKWETGDT